MLAGEGIITGQVQKSDIATKIPSGKVGGVLDLKGMDNIKAMQEMAVKQTRLGIPLLFAMDVIHGYETIFPIPLAMSCTWELNAIEESARIAESEARADGICWTFSPMVDISRDPRWGRVAEGAGEDPLLGGMVAQVMGWGYQGKHNPLTQTDHIIASIGSANV